MLIAVVLRVRRPRPVPLVISHSLPSERAIEKRDIGEYLALLAFEARARKKEKT